MKPVYSPSPISKANSQLNQQSKMNSPIIFCHFGNTPYLYYSLRSAKISNPEKEVFLFGDSSNQKLAKELSINHVNSDELTNTELYHDFQKVYKRVKGKKAKCMVGGKNVEKYMIERYFYIYQFCHEKNIDRVWFFDSDTMIVSDLKAVENLLDDYDYTEQCQASCMKGLLKLAAIKNFISNINQIFQDEEHLRAIQSQCDKNPSWSLSEITLYRLYKKYNKYKRVDLRNIFDNKTFDDCICHQHGYEMETLPYGQEIKKIFMTDDGRFWGKKENEFVQFLSINLSWVPDYLFEIIFSHLSQSPIPGQKKTLPSDESNSLGKHPSPTYLYIKYWLKNYIKNKLT